MAESYDSYLWKIAKYMEKEFDWEIGTNVQSLHDRLRDCFKTLKGENSSYKYVPKLMLYEGGIPIKVCATFFRKYIEYLNMSDASNQKSPNRKALSNWKKVGLKYKSDFLNILLKEYKRSISTKLVNSLGRPIKKEENLTTEILNKEYRACKGIFQLNIREEEQNLSKRFDSITNVFQGKDPRLTNYLEERLGCLGKLKEFCRAILFTDIHTWYLIRWCIKLVKDDFLDIDKKKMLDEISIILKKQLNNIEISPVEFNDKGDVDDFTMYFVLWQYRDRMLSEIEIGKYIIGQSKLLEIELDDEYDVSFDYPQIPDYFNSLEDWIMDMEDDIFEGREEKRTRYRENAWICMECIQKLNKLTQGKVPLNDVHFKAAYRAFFLDQTEYDRRKAQTIMKHFLIEDEKEIFRSPEDYYFVKQLLNLNLFREQGIYEEAVQLLDVERKLYDIQFAILSSLRPRKIIAEAEKIYKVLYLELENIVKQ